MTLRPGCGVERAPTHLTGLRRGAMLLAALLALAAPAGAQEVVAGPPSAPYIVEDACPFECCTYGEWTLPEGALARSVPERRPGDGTRLAPGTRIQVDTGFVRITRIGKVLVRETFWESGPSEDYAHGTRFEPGDTIYVLDYVGEGFFNAWHRGKEVQPAMYWDDPSVRTGPTPEMPGLLLTAPESEWWVRARLPDGRALWLDMAEVDDVDGFDACG